MKPDPGAKDRATALRTAAVTMIVVSVLFLLEQATESPYPMLARHAGSATVTIAIDPGRSGPAGGLRSVMIHGPGLAVCWGPSGPGGPTSTDVAVDPEAMRRVLAALRHYDGLDDDHRTWSGAIANPWGSPPPRRRHRVIWIDPPSCEIRVSVNRTGHNRDWVADLPLDRRALALFDDLGRAVPALAGPMRQLAASAPPP